MRAIATNLRFLGGPPVDRTSEVAACAYEPFQQRVHGESEADQGGFEAKRET